MSTDMKTIWGTLSRLDVSKHVEKKNGLSYLSWAWAWGTLMEHYPEATYEFPEALIHRDDTVTVFCTVTIGGLSRTMWLPVLDYRNKPIPNPSSFDYNTARMRCLVKCLAMFGLGHYIYAGEDVPQGGKHDPMDKENLEVGEDEKKYAKAFMEAASDGNISRIAMLHHDCQEEGEEFYRGVWSLLDSKARSYIKKALRPEEAA